MHRNLDDDLTKVEENNALAADLSNVAKVKVVAAKPNALAYKIAHEAKP